MTFVPASPSADHDPQPEPERNPTARGHVVLFGILLALAVIVAGLPELAAPWLPGDEFIFIVDNPNVNPAADAAPANRSLAARLGAICASIHDDLFQPIPMLTYALEWAWSGGDPLSFRRTDLLLHVVNALLVWRVLAVLLRRATMSRASPATLLAWSLALLWALHPALVGTYASDMGRTHLLSALFALVSLELHLRTLVTGRQCYFVGAAVALLLAMLSKPVVGWILLAVVVEVAWHGWRPTFASPRVYVIGVICAAFAALTLWTSVALGFAREASQGLFGDPIARGALAVWLYFRDLIAPFWLTFWHLPDPATSWRYPLVWIGLGLTLGSWLHAAFAWRRAETRLTTVGWIWCWALLLPVLGLVGAREVAAADRYLYQPLMGIMLVIGVALCRAVPAARAARVAVPVAALLAASLLLWDLPQCAIARSAVRRAKRVAELNPRDPRALEALGVAYDFAQDHPLPAKDLATVPTGRNQREYFRTLWSETLVRTAAVGDLARYFPRPSDRGPFHRRMSLRFLRAGDAVRSLEQAHSAAQEQPDVFASWTRVAQAYQALGHLDDAANAYERAEHLLPADPETRVVHFTNYGYLLLFDLDHDAEGCSKFAAALQTGWPLEATKLGLALCEIRYGDGAAGFKLISELLQADPTNAQAGLVLAEYHLRSHHWDLAARVYDALLRDDPTSYGALRGFQEVCLQTGRRNDATLAWAEAAQREPERREFKSYLVWSLALAGTASATAAAQELLASDPDNPLACFARMLELTRKSDLTDALQWIGRAHLGKPIPKAREFERAASAVHFLLSTGELPAEAVVVWAAVLAEGDFPSSARADAALRLEKYRAAVPDSPWQELAQRVQDELSDHPPER